MKTPSEIPAPFATQMWFLLNTLQRNKKWNEPQPNQWYMQQFIETKKEKSSQGTKL